MTLDQYHDTTDKLLAPLVSIADAIGLLPNGVNVVTFGFAVAADIAFGLADSLWCGLGATFVFCNGWLDLVGGTLAHEQGISSKAGDLLDHVLDRHADIVVLVGLAAGVDSFALGLTVVTDVLTTSYLGTQVQTVGLGRAYGSLVGRADRLAFMGLVGLASTVCPSATGGLTLAGWLLVFFAVVGHLTAAQRFWGAWGNLT